MALSAINGAQLEVKFSTAVDESSVIDSADGTLKDGVFTIDELTTDGVAANAVDDADNLKATLSEDGKTLTINADTYFDGRYELHIKADSVATEDGTKLSAYSTVVTVKDTVKPTVVNVTYPNNKTARVNFSEPLSYEGTVTAVYADGTSATVSASLNPGDKYIDLDLTSVTANKDVTVTIVGAKDKKGNLTSPNPVTVTVKKDTTDTTAPTVQSITPVSSTAFDIKLSEAVKLATTADVTTPGKILVGATDVTSKATVDTTDPTVIHVTGITAVSGLQTITVEADALVDMSGNPNAQTSKVVNFSADTTAPTVTSTSVQTINNVKYLVVNFNEYVTPQAGKLLVFEYVNENGEKDSTTITTATSGGGQGEATLYNPVNGKSKSIKININNLASEEYTVDLVEGLVKDLFGNDSELKSDVAVTIASAPKQEVLLDADGSSGNDDDNGVEVVDNNTLRVHFKYPLDITSATTASNYTVEGATVSKAEIYKNNSTDGYIVELTLADNTVEIDGEYEVTVRNVKAKDGLAMETAYTSTETLVENVVPTIVKAELTDLDTITLTFSEPVTNAAADTDDFELLIGGVKVAANDTITTAAQTTAAKTLTLTLEANVTPDDLAKGLSIKALDTIDVQDANGNVAVVATPVAVTQ
ncbi:hypothetical protein [Brevibacillus aydinogluensis]|uniref:SbsA Ig-like domain-containing protein n=1 Tax=Brevibacillus aydinogluensis TaxID=927786 RepID=A0AA48M685_9BACL|nr:hypothetical protein [Brevibacillus aydinogluensis]CAJ1001056.1 hypothetical protein BSPP4475_01790 [Brevibacillus aydinogluensis]